MKGESYLISGAGSGIGRSIALRLAAEGAGVLLAGRDIVRLESTATLLPTGTTYKLIPLDIRDRQACVSAAESLQDITLNGIIANAGVGGENHFGPNDRWQEIIETNLTGTYQFVHAFLPLLRKRSAVFGHVVLISSVLARLGVRNYTAYCASKAGLLGLMRSWAVDLAPEKILVNAICPGWVNTKMSEDGMAGIALGLGVSKDEFYSMAMRDVPLGKMSEPEEIAQLLSYLLHQKSITGQTIDINGGSVMNS
jgi:NAD(P)-dependent dehydrogenase (short-subunit alcohol dehydrogenase family)